MADTKAVCEALRQVIDPELELNVVDLGLIYDIQVDAESGTAAIRMTLTTPGCPIGESILTAVGEAACTVPGVRTAEVRLVWNPPWHPGLITPEGKAQLARR